MPRKKGVHLTLEERCQIYAYLKSGLSKRSISKLLRVSHTAINRELQRNRSKNGYRYGKAHQLAQERRKKASGRQRKLTPRMIALITSMLKESQASPVQIAGRLKRQCLGSVSHETIYSFIRQNRIGGGNLYTYLRRKAKPYNYKHGKSANRGAIPGRVDISNRPDIVEEKSRFGDFELDTIIGAQHKGAIVSIVDRASKYVFLRLIDRATASNVTTALLDCLRPLAKNLLVKTLTSDNGKEFSNHRSVSMHLDSPFYFATPYHSWERGLNEHTNGLVRQYFPKGTRFDTISNNQVQIVEQKLNERPRKILDFATPYEAFTALTQSNQSGNFRA